MRILDINGEERTDADSELGRTEEETIVIAHHEAVEAVEEVGHYEVIAEYPNGGRDVAWVVDVPGVEAAPAWDETETILRFTPYTEEELAARQAEREAERAAAEARERENALLCAQVAAMKENLAFLEDCLVEMAELVYA